MHFALYGRNIGAEATDRLNMLLRHLILKGVRLSLFADLDRQLRPVLNEDRWSVFTGSQDIPSDVDIFLSLGGDGTFLSSLTLLGKRNIPVAGVNFGRLGFLTSAGQEDCGCEMVDRILAGTYRVEHRTLLRLSGENLPEDFYRYALNEVSIQRYGPNMIGIEVTVDGMKIPTYWADGLLIATPTGSTAYSLSIGGPVVMPESSVFIIAPVAPHNLNVRPLIVPDTSVIEVDILSKGKNILLSADNRFADLQDGCRVRVQKADFRFPCVHLSPDSFFEALNEKLLWGEDRRNGKGVNITGKKL